MDLNIKIYKEITSRPVYQLTVKLCESTLFLVNALDVLETEHSSRVSVRSMSSCCPALSPSVVWQNVLFNISAYHFPSHSPHALFYFLILHLKTWVCDLHEDLCKWSIMFT